MNGWKLRTTPATVVGQPPWAGMWESQVGVPGQVSSLANPPEWVHCQAYAQPLHTESLMRHAIKLIACEAAGTGSQGQT